MDHCADRGGRLVVCRNDFHVRWFDDGVLNVSVNCIDRHLASRGDQIALIWDADDPAEEPRRYTYAALHEEVCASPTC